MRILIIDDSKSVQKSVSWKLTKKGHEIVGAGSDGYEGLQLYAKTRPDLVLLDITMPNKDGRQCLKEILEMNSNAKIVMLSALSTQEIIDDCLKSGAIAFIDKNQIMTQEYLESQISEIITKFSLKCA